jgi:CPA2 family monovalent cation:H+ antiporter-2
VHDATCLLEAGGVILLLAILARAASGFGFSPIRLYLLAGFAFGQGGSSRSSRPTGSSRRVRRSG